MLGRYVFVNGPFYSIALEYDPSINYVYSVCVRCVFGIFVVNSDYSDLARYIYDVRSVYILLLCVFLYLENEHKYLPPYKIIFCSFDIRLTSVGWNRWA